MHSITTILKSLIKYKKSNDFIKIPYFYEEDDKVYSKSKNKYKKYAKVHPEINNDIQIINL